MSWAGLTDAVEAEFMPSETPWDRQADRVYTQHTARLARQRAEARERTRRARERALRGRTCPVCGGPMPLTFSGRMRVYCSDRCGFTARNWRRRGTPTRAA